MYLNRLDIGTVVGAHVLTVVDVEVATLGALVVSTDEELVVGSIQIDECHLLVAAEVDGILILLRQ